MELDSLVLFLVSAAFLAGLFLLLRYRSASVQRREEEAYWERRSSVPPMVRR